MARHASSDSLPSAGGQRPVAGSYTAKVCKVVTIAVVSAILMSSGCSNIPVGLSPSADGEKFYLVKDVYLTPGSAYYAKDVFDHGMNDVINLCFTCRNEKNHYVVKTIWYDPAGQEYRTIRRTYDITREGQKAITPRRHNEGTPRVITVSVGELYDHKPGRWKVDLYLDGEMAKGLEFTVK